ncbi:MAG TPA: response regulator transcription factor [Nocardioidaceae bacterium]|nr:response regulator transcription factor [Nocardioidaceae bacterium]
MIEVVIADDQDLVREGLRMMLDAEPDIRVVGEASTGKGAIARAHELAPDVVLMDIRMPELDGIEATRRLASAGSSAKVLVLTTFDLDEYVYRAMRAGASGFLLKDMPAEDIVTAVRQVARGADALLAPALTRRLVDRFTETGARLTTVDLDRLTAREVDVLRLLGRGQSNAEIAAELFIGETTVKTHVARILLKLGLRDRVQAAILAHDAGLA